MRSSTAPAPSPRANCPSSKAETGKSEPLQSASVGKLPPQTPSITTSLSASGDPHTKHRLTAQLILADPSAPAKPPSCSPSASPYAITTPSPPSPTTSSRGIPLPPPFPPNSFPPQLTLSPQRRRRLPNHARRPPRRAHHRHRNRRVPPRRRARRHFREPARAAGPAPPV